MQIIFQNPHAALNPRRTVFQSVAEPLIVQRVASGAALRSRVGALLTEVGLPETFSWRCPSQFASRCPLCDCSVEALDARRQPFSLFSHIVGVLAEGFEEFQPLRDIFEFLKF